MPNARMAKIHCKINEFCDFQLFQAGLCRKIFGTKTVPVVTKIHAQFQQKKALQTGSAWGVVGK